jgi:hypothetical protein
MPDPDDEFIEVFQATEAAPRECGYCRFVRRYVDEQKFHGTCSLTDKDVMAEDTCAFYEARGLHHALKSREDRERENRRH